MLFNGVRPFSSGLQTFFGDHHLTNINVHGFLRLYQAVFLFHHELFECVNIYDLVGIEHKLADLIFFMRAIRGILFLREIKKALLEERFVSLS